jgi:hypothetical protein
MCHVEKAHTDLEDNDDDDPVIAEYDVFLTDSSIQRFLFQYPDRKPSFPYNSLLEQKPEELRIKPRTGLVEVDIPIDTTINYDGRKGAQYSEAMKKSRLVKGGGSYGMAGGFSEGPLPTLKIEDGGGASRRRSTIDLDMGEGVPLAVQTLGGRVVPTKDGDPIYMLGAFQGGLYSALTQSVIFVLLTNLQMNYISASLKDPSNFDHNYTTWTRSTTRRDWAALS